MKNTLTSTWITMEAQNQGEAGSVMFMPMMGKVTRERAIPRRLPVRYLG